MFLVCEIIGIIFIILMIHASYHKTRLPDFKAIKLRGSEQYCLGNVKMLENALEMYDMDHPSTNSDVTTVVCVDGNRKSLQKYFEVFLNRAYMSRLPLCPFTGKFGTYHVSRDATGKMFVDCEMHGSISVPLVKKL